MNPDANESEPEVIVESGRIVEAKDEDEPRDDHGIDVEQEHADELVPHCNLGVADEIRQWSMNVQKSFWNLNKDDKSETSPGGHVKKHVDQSSLSVAAVLLEPDCAVQCRWSGHNAKDRNCQTNDFLRTRLRNIGKEVFIDNFRHIFVN